jgi:hypothetical protein
MYWSNIFPYGSKVLAEYNMMRMISLVLLKEANYIIGRYLREGGGEVSEQHGEKKITPSIYFKCCFLSLHTYVNVQLWLLISLIVYYKKLLKFYNLKIFVKKNWQYLIC